MVKGLDQGSKLGQMRFEDGVGVSNFSPPDHMLVFSDLCATTPTQLVNCREHERDFNSFRFIGIKVKFVVVVALCHSQHVF